MAGLPTYLPDAPVQAPAARFLTNSFAATTIDTNDDLIPTTAYLKRQDCLLKQSHNCPNNQNKILTAKSRVI